MCTVSFVYKNGLAILTSNRDEKVSRPTAIAPKSYLINSKTVIYPKDLKAGGTWFAVDQDGTVLILLNGAKEKHISENNYTKSRGLVVLEIIGSTSPINFWNEIALHKIEPFTIVLFQNQQLYQLQWDGAIKNKLELDIHQKHIWSSSTLYEKSIREKRSSWFYDYVARNPEINAANMIDFHKNTHTENHENGLIINRNNQLKTISITQVVNEKNKIQVKYLDLIKDNEFSSTLI